MAFAIIELQSCLWTITSQGNIKNRIGNMGKCLIFNKYENITVIGCHNDYNLLNEMCIQHNTNTMTVSLSRNDYSHYITPDQPIVLMKPVTPLKLKPYLEKVEGPKLIRKRLFTEYKENSLDLEGILPLEEERPFESTGTQSFISVQVPSSEQGFIVGNNDNKSLPTEMQTVSDVASSEEMASTQIVIDPPPLVPIQSTVQAKSRKAKSNYCKYCGEKKTCLSRHIIAKHKEVPEVKDYITLSTSNPKKGMLLSKIRRDGNFQHSFQNNSNMVPSRIVKCVDPSKYVACPYCKIILTKEALRRHIRVYCASLADNKKARGALKLSKSLTDKIDDCACKILKQSIFPCFREGAVKETIRFDRLLIIYANEMCAKYRSQHHYPMIRNRLILMAKLLIYMKTIDPLLQDFESILQASRFKNILICINKFGEYDEETGVYLKPTLPTTIGTALKYIIHLFKAECIINGKQKEKQNAEELLHLLTTSLPAHVNKNATESLLKLKRQKPVKLPSTQDIKKMNVYILKKRSEYFEKLELGFEYKNWLELAKYTLISILIFNRRRPGELQRCQINDLKSIQGIDNSDLDIFNSLSENDKKTIVDYKRFTIRGKLARGVPVLLHNNMHKCVEKIIQYREEAGVQSANPYIFGLPQSKGIDKKKVVYRYLLATDLMRDFSTKCGASNPETLRATQLRKHIATKSVSLNLKDSEISNLQAFLGHADKVHKEYYRQPIIVDDILKMSKLLLIAQGDQSTSESSTISNVTNDSSRRLPTATDISDLNTLDGSSSSLSTLPGPSRCLSPIREELSGFLNSPATQEIEGFQLSNDSEDSKDRDYVPIDDDDNDVSDEEKGPRKRRLLDINLGQTVRITWNTPEKHTMEKIFESHLKNKQIPTASECSNMIKLYPILKSRTVPQMQMWLRNRLKRNNRQVFCVQVWTTPERHTIRKLFGEYIQGSSYPSVKTIQETIINYPELKNRTPRRIRSQIQHQKKLFKNRLKFGS